MSGLGGFIVSMRWWLVPAMLLSYILYHAFIKKKRLDSLKNDIGVFIFVIAVYFGLYRVLFR